MAKLIAFCGTDCLSLPEQEKNKKRNPQGLTTADFRRLLSEMRRRPPSERAFLRKLLKRAIASGDPVNFPVTDHVVGNPISPC
jgi:hypothetical protein